MRCSNATWIVDRLEARGLAERRARAGDRRVKLVVLTAAGVRTRDKLRAATYEPPPKLLASPPHDTPGTQVGGGQSFQVRDEGQVRIPRLRPGWQTRPRRTASPTLATTPPPSASD